MIYEDPLVNPVPLDLHSACAIGHYELVKESIDRKENLNACNKGKHYNLVCVPYGYLVVMIIY